MTEIKPHLFLGGYKDAYGDIPRWYKSVGATHVLCVASEITPPTIEGVFVKHLPIPDDDPSTDIATILPGALAFIVDALDRGGNVLIHCRSGASRAVCVTLAVLVKHFGYSLVDAYHFVARRRQAMNVFPVYLNQLEAWCRFEAGKKLEIA